MASSTQWTWVWANSGRWWRTEEAGVLQSLGYQKAGHDWVTEQQQYPKGRRQSSCLPSPLLRGQLFCFRRQKRDYDDTEAPQGDLNLPWVYAHGQLWPLTIDYAISASSSLPTQDDLNLWEYVFQNRRILGFPWQSSSYNSAMQGMCVWYLVGELRSHMPPGAAKKRRVKKKKILAFGWTEMNVKIGLTVYRQNEK